MIKTIKVKKQLRLDELIKYVWDNDVQNGRFRSKESDMLVFVEHGRVFTEWTIDKCETFTVEVEEEVTDDTGFEGVQEIYIDAEGLLGVEYHPFSARKSINDVLEERDEETECLYIYAAVDGKTELIWEGGSDE